MATQWLRRQWLFAASASVLLLAGCGGGEVDSQLAPARIVAFGDAMADIGQKAAGTRYTVNDGSVNNWTLVVAQAFGVPLAPRRSGGLSYATGNARVETTPGAGNDPAAPSVSEQIGAFLGAGNSFSDRDLVLVNAGTSDVIVQAQAVIGGVQTRDQALAAVGQAGTAFGAQVRRLVNAGARHVVVVGPYNLGRSVWAKQTGQAALLEAASSEFNTKLLLAIQDLGDSVLYVDAALQFNIYEANPGSYDLDNVKEAVCTSTDSADPEDGIGTGTGQVDSSECTTGTVVTTSYDRYLFADRVYPTPRGHRLFGEHAVARIRQRW